MSAPHLLDPDTFGGRVRYWRHQRGLSQPAMSARTGIPVPQLSHIELGRSGVSISRLSLLAQALKVSTDVLLGLESSPCQHGESLVTDYQKGAP